MVRFRVPCIMSISDIQAHLKISNDFLTSLWGRGSGPFEITVPSARMALASKILDLDSRAYHVGALEERRRNSEEMTGLLESNKSSL